MVDPDDDDWEEASEPGAGDPERRKCSPGKGGPGEEGAADAELKISEPGLAELGVSQGWLAEMRELRNSERAPDAVCERVLENLRRELGVQRASAVRSLSFEQGLFEKSPFEAEPLGQRSLEKGQFGERLEALFAAETRPLFARLAGATLLVSLLVVAFADVRRDAGSDGPAGGDANGGASGESKPFQRPPLPDFRDEPSYPKDAVVSCRGDVAAAIEGNLLTNGDFSRGALLWSVRELNAFGDLSTDAEFAVRDGALCGVIRAGEYVLGGWPFEDRRLSPNSFEIVKGTRYRLSLRAWSPGPKPVDLVVKLGHQEPPFAASLVAVVPVGTAPERFDVEFVARGDDENAGFAFIGAGPLDARSSELCLDDVVFQQVGR